jgi:hypothetical protein
MHCRRCGEILNANANFCWSCGAAQVGDSSPETIAVPVVTAGETLVNHHVAPTDVHDDELVVVSGPDAGERFILSDDVTDVGRHDECAIVLDDVSVSRRHATLTRTGSGRITIRDLNSLNGTYVNGERVDEAVLREGDDVQIGKYKLVFWARSA